VLSFSFLHALLLLVEGWHLLLLFIDLRLILGVKPALESDLDIIIFPVLFVASFPPVWDQLVFLKGVLC
jgi:hypothetical protein